MTPELTSLQEAYNQVYTVDEATAMAKRGLNEPAIRTQIAKSTGGGESADRATKLADKQSFGQGDSKARENLARTQRGDFRKTTSSSPGLQGYAHKTTNDADKAKQSARGAQRGVLTPDEKKKLNREEFDIYDIVLEYLLDEGYAESVKEAESIMVNMSEDWRESIMEVSDAKVAAVGRRRQSDVNKSMNSNDFINDKPGATQKLATAVSKKTRFDNLNKKRERRNG
jgi:hypothetical protein